MANKKPYKVKVTIGDSVVEVEGEEKGVVAIVQALSEVVRAGRKTPESVAEPTTLEPSPRSGQTDIRTFFEEKQSSSDVEAAAVAAYYYKYLAPAQERRDAIRRDRCNGSCKCLPSREATPSCEGCIYAGQCAECGLPRLKRRDGVLSLEPSRI